MARDHAAPAPGVLVHRVRIVPVGSPGPEKPVDLRIRGGRVREIEPALRPFPDEHVLDADGRWAIPGLWDQHVHLRQWAEHGTRVDVAGTESPTEVTRTLATHLARLPAGDDDGSIVGYGFRPGTWSRQPTVSELDAVTGARPVVLISGDAHTGWLNSAAMRVLGVAPRGGPLDEKDWFPLYDRLDELPGLATLGTEAVRRAVLQAASRGVVGIVDFEFGRPHADWTGRVARGVDQLRVRAATYPDGLEEVVAAGLRTGRPLPDGAGLLEMGPLKIISDGSLNSRTAFCCDPYADPADPRHPYGKQNYSHDELVELMERARDAGLEVAVHAIGDAAVSSALGAFARTGARGSVEHAQLMRHEDVARMAALGVTASVQPAHLLDDRDATAHSWPDRTDRCFPLRSLLDAGVTLALGSDAPVAPLDPWLAMAASVHRSADERAPWNARESLTARQALAASTDGQGTLAPGSRGDLVLLDADPLQVPECADAARRLRSLPVATTLLAGRPTFDTIGMRR